MQSFAEKIITALAINEVEFIVVGGISAVLQGVPDVGCAAAGEFKNWLNEIMQLPRQIS